MQLDFNAASAPRKRVSKGLQAKQDEKRRLHRAYRAGVRKRMKEAFEQEPRLRGLRRWIRRHRSAHQLLTAIADSWMRKAPVEHRRIALQMISAHCDKLAILEGRGPLNDPMPPRTSVFLIARALLESDGKMR